jgi:pimeloyl-ACP methyl ester carboxylesterase
LSVTGSPRYPMGDERVAELAGAMWDRGYSVSGIVRQIHAISASGDRTQALRRLTVPTAVLHGSADPLARPAAGRATAKAIPDARLRIFEGMGHDLPEALWPDFAEEIAVNASRARDLAPSA